MKQEQPKQRPEVDAKAVVERLKRPGLVKRLLVSVYDLLLLLGVVMMSSVVFLLIPDSISAHIITRIIKGIYIVGVIFAFYGYFWTHGGQTLGMRVWHMHLIDANGKYIDWPTAFKRFCVAVLSLSALGLGFAWLLLNRERRTWHDFAARTHVVLIPAKR